MVMKILKKTALEHFGGTTKLAIALGIKHSAVSQWGEYVPLLRAYQIRELIAEKDQAAQSREDN